MRLFHHYRFAVGIFALLLVSVTSSAYAQVSLKITNVVTCDDNGNPFTPHVGDAYGVRVEWSVSGTPKAKYTVRFTVANQTYDLTGRPAAAGNYYGYARWHLPLDEQIPYTVMLDVNHVTGDSNTANHFASGTFTPIPPATTIEYFNPLVLTGTETFTVNWTVGSKVQSAFLLLGVPTTDTFQKVLQTTPPPASGIWATNPTGDPVWKTNLLGYTATAASHAWVDTQSFVVQESSVIVNPDLMRRGQWSTLGILDPSLYVYTLPDANVQSNDPTIASFVAATLPANYRTSLTLYDAARQLYLAVVRHTSLVANVPLSDAVTVLKTGKGDGIGMSLLYCACLRHVGIPARTLVGWTKGQDKWYGMMEFFVPNCGWVQADAGGCAKYWDPTGTYSFLFGYLPQLNSFCVVSRGTNHQIADQSIPELQFGWFYYTNGTGNYNYTDTCSLQ